MALVDAIKSLQKELGVKPDGVFGPKTEAALKKALAPKSKPVTVAKPSDGKGVLNARSLKHLAQCDERLQRIAVEARKDFAFTVICGHRNKADQDAAFKGGFSKVKWPNSKHNKTPSLAFDACPDPIDFSKRVPFLNMREHFQKTADKLGIKVRFISWDLPHIQLA